MNKSYSIKELEEVLLNVDRRRGWNFSSMKIESEPAPWDYNSVIKKYLKSTDKVLDIGTGGGEKLIKLTKYYQHALGIDIDPEMINIAKENSGKIDNVEFTVSNENMDSIRSVFDMITDRHSPFNLSAIREHLKNEGYFITQQVGERNMLNIKQVLHEIIAPPPVSKTAILDSRLKLVAFEEYNIEYVVKDIQSLIFWLNALNLLHADIDGSKALKDLNIINEILKNNVDKRGFVTNEHRYLVIAKKTN